MEITPAKKRKLNPSKYIPLHMIEVILSKLPVKSLVRFMSVSQPWNSIITNPSFSNLRSNIAYNLLVLNQDFDLLTIDRAGKSLITLNPPFTRPYTEIIGSCNGLVCISRTGHCADIAVWNPCTGIFRELPNSSRPLGFTDCYSYGFGYDSLSKDFKIVLAVEQYSDDSVFYYVEVFSLKLNSWRRIRNSVDPEDSIVGEPGHWMRGTHVNGVLYWNIDGVVHAFDLGSENFFSIPSPEPHCYMVVLNDCLSLTASTGIWFLKRRGGVNSWVKFIFLDMKGDIRPLFMTKTGIIAKKFVEAQREDIVAITVPGGKTRTLFEIGDGWNMCDAITYVEDLVSPTALISEIEDVNAETRVVQSKGNYEVECQSEQNS